MEIEGLITDLAFLLLLGAVVTIIFKWIRQPVVLGYIVAGFLASPHFEYLPSVTTESNIEFWAQIGIVVLLFSLGLEFSFKKLLNVGGSAAVTSLIIVAGMMCCGFAIGTLLGFSRINSLFLGGMMSMSSTTIIIKALTDLGMRQRKFASIVFAVLIVEDLFAVLMMVILSSIAINESVEGGELLFSIAKLVFFLIIWFLVGVYLIPSILNACRRFINAESLLVISMGLCLGMAVFSVACGFSLALGAFVMGSILAGTSYAERIEQVTSPVKDLFGAVFFISVGMMVQPGIIVQYWWPILVLSVVVIGGMIFFGTAGMLITGQPLKIAIESGFCLTQIGEFAFIIASLGMSLGVLNAEIYPIVVAVSVITTFTTPYFIKMSASAYRFAERILPGRLHFLIDRYSKEAETQASNTNGWGMVMRRYVWRTLLYSCVLIAISLVARMYLSPWLAQIFPSWARLIVTVVTLLAMGPFLLALMSPTSRPQSHYPVGKKVLGVEIPLVVMWLFRVVVAMVFVINVISAEYSMAIGVSVGVAVVFLLVLLLSRKTRARLGHIESKFFNNLNERELRRSGRNNSVVSDLHLGHMEVGYSCPFVGERLKNSGLRSRFGVNVVSIQRGGTVYNIPDADMRIFPGDVLGIVGTDLQIQRLLPIVEQSDDEMFASSDEYHFTNFLLPEESMLVGKTSASASVRNTYHVLVVAIRRGEEYIDVTPDTVFEAGDILWVAGPRSAITELKDK